MSLPFNSLVSLFVQLCFLVHCPAHDSCNGTFIKILFFPPFPPFLVARYAIVQEVVVMGSSAELGSRVRAGKPSARTEPP